VHRQFGCDNPPSGGVGWVNIGVLRFADAPSAAAAVGTLAKSRAAVTRLRPAEAIDLGESAAALGGPTINGTEYTLYASDGPLVYRVTGVAPQGDPRPDVEAIATAVYNHGQRLGMPNAIEAALLAPTPYAVPETAPTLAPAPTTAPPTPIPAPTATSIPTATAMPTPLPTATATPTPPPDNPPALIPVTVPTAAAPQPTMSAGPLPTPTPRVIRPPTPDAG
jgi:hypothetical protein